jgi:predicted transglutaminase-like cysteine proteinase
MKDGDTPYILGLIIAAALFLILRRNNESQSINDLQQSGIGINNWKSLNYVQDFDEFNSRLTQSIKPVAVSQSVEQNVEQDLQIVEQKVDHIEQIDDNSTQYKNKEVWKIARNQDGDIEEISVSRDARVT